MIISDAEAQAVTATANTVSKGIDLIHGFGAWLDETVGSIPASLLRVAGGDWLGEVADRNLARMRAKTALILEGIALERITEPSPSVVLPLLTAAMDESREELQDLWAALLANAMLDGGRRVRRDYLEAVRQMEPTDAAVLEITNRVSRMADDTGLWRFVEHECQLRELTKDTWEIGVAKLVQLNCVGIWTTTDHGTLALLTSFGRGLLAACQAPSAC